MSEGKASSTLQTAPSSAPKAAMAGQRKCWECRRRRRVCDMNSPACQQCQKDGIACSGYGKNKPVTFLPIGAKNRQKRGEDGKALDLRHPMDRQPLRSSNVTQASLPRDLVRQQDVYFANAANFCTLSIICLREQAKLTTRQCTSERSSEEAILGYNLRQPLILRGYSFS